MKIAVASEGKQVSAHFGHCEGFNIFEIVDGKVSGSTYEMNPGHCKAAPVFLSEQGVKVVIGGGMGAGARNNLTSFGIEVITGASGEAAEVVQLFLDGTLKTVGGECSGHGHDHGGTCGGHGSDGTCGGH